MLKNAQTIGQLHSFHLLVILCSKFFKLGFNSTLTENFLMYSFKEEEEPEIQIANIHWIIEKAKEFQKNVYFCFIDYTKAFDCVDYNKLWKMYKDMGIPDHITCLRRNLYAGKYTTVRTRHGIMAWFKTGKGVRQTCILPLCLFKLYVDSIVPCSIVPCLVLTIAFWPAYRFLRRQDMELMSPFLLESRKWENQDGKESVCNVENPGLIPGSGISHGERDDYPLQ